MECMYGPNPNLPVLSYSPLEMPMTDVQNSMPPGIGLVGQGLAGDLGPFGLN